jgi:hypothetical protein
MVPLLPFNPINVKECQVFSGRIRAVEVQFTDGTSQIFDEAEVTDELWAFATTKLVKTFKPDLRRLSSKN